MYSVRVGAELGDRLDAEFYSPVAIATVAQIEALGATSKLGDLILEGYRVVYHGTDSVIGVAEDKLLPFLSPTQIDDQGTIDFDSIDKLPLYYKTEYPKGIAKPGELLIEVKGNVSKVGVVPVVHPANLMISGSLYKASLRPSVDSRYVFAYLKSKHGQVLKNRLTSNTIINYIAKDDLYSIPVWTPVESIQKYIGNKVRQVEALCAWAKSLETRFAKKLADFAPEVFQNHSTGKRHSRVAPIDISYTLNPGAFDEERVRVRRHLSGLGSVSLRSLVEIGGANTSEYSPKTTYLGLDSIASGSCRLAPVTAEEAQVSGACRVLTEGPIVAKLRPYLNKVSYFPKRLAGAIGSTELMCVTPNSGVSGWYVYGVLKSELTLKQLRPLATGATHPRIDQYDLNDLVVPLLDDQEELGSLLETAQQAYFLSRELACAASVLVEALIDGKIEGRDVIDAQVMSEAGGNSLDIRILGRLKTDGIDGTGKPLIGELDQMYDLLDRATKS